MRGDLRVLDERSLLTDLYGEYRMHGLVRGYIQQEFEANCAKAFRESHWQVGQQYFPLTKGRRKVNPDSKDREKYSDAAGCALALHHFEKAGRDGAQREVIGNVYENEVSRAKWLLNYGNSPDNPRGGCRAAEQVLRRVLHIYADRAKESVYEGADEVPWDINALMARALISQGRADLLLEAAFHLRQAVDKGSKDQESLLISVLCDIATKLRGNDTQNSEWVEVQQRFEAVRERVRSAPRATIAERTGMTYEKVSRVMLTSNSSQELRPQVWAILNEAISAGLKWDGLYEIGHEMALQEGELHQAEKLLEAGLAAVPQSMRLWVPYCVLMAKAGRLRSLDAELRLRRRPKGVEGTIRLARLLLKEHLVEDAQTCLAEAWNIYDHNPTICLAWAELLEQAGEFRQAETVYRDTTKNWPTANHVCIAFGHSLELREDWERAEQVYRDGIKAQPAHYLCYLALGKLLERRDDLPGAEKAYRDGINANRASYECHLALGKLQEKRQDLAGAEKVYRDGIKAQSAHYECYLALGKLLETRNDLGAAEQAYRDGINANLASSECHLALGKLLETRNDLTGAEQAYRDGIKVQPAQYQCYLALGKLREKGQDLVGAEQAYRDSIKVQPAQYECYLPLGKLLEAKGDWDGAELVYRTGSELTHHPALAVPIGICLVRQNRLLEAAKWYESHLREHPDHAFGVQKYGEVLETLGRREEAKQVFSEFCARVPDNWRAHYGLGRLLENGQESVEAEQSYREALNNTLRLDPSSPLFEYSEEVPIALGTLLATQGRFAEAQRVYEETLDVFPGFDKVRALLSALRNGPEGPAAEKGEAPKT
jgi:tetratricopeptide (TPR) repeat protein